MKLPKVVIEISAFELEEIKRIEAMRNRKPERGVIPCMCCEKYFPSPDRRRIHFCPGCKEHASNARAFGCPTRLLEIGGVSLSKQKHDPSHYSNSHLFNARPKYKDRRRRHEDIPEEEELDFEEDLEEVARLAKGRDE